MISKKISPLLVALVATATASSAWALPAATGSSAAGGNYSYVNGTKSGFASGSESDYTGALVESAAKGGGFGFDASAESSAGALKAYAGTKFSNGGWGYSSANSTATFTDYITFSGGTGASEGSLVSLLEGSLTGGKTGNASYFYSISLFDTTSGTSESLVWDSHAVSGKQKLKLNNEYGADFSFNFGTTYQLVASLSLYAGNGGTADFSDTAMLSFDMGSADVKIATASGFNYGVPAVPEPQTYAMLLAGLGMISVMARRRTKM